MTRSLGRFYVELEAEKQKLNSWRSWFTFEFSACFYRLPLCNLNVHGSIGPFWLWFDFGTVDPEKEKE